MTPFTGHGEYENDLCNGKPYMMYHSQAPDLNLVKQRKQSSLSTVEGTSLERIIDAKVH